MALVIRS